jgi:hypothetical protein
MCYYRLYIFLGCGHSNFAATPVSYCHDARPVKRTNSIKRRSRDDKSAKSPTTSTRKSDLEAVSRPTKAPRVSLLNASPSLKHDKHTRVRSVRKPKEKLVPCDERRAHPLHTIRLERMCSGCEAERDERLQELEENISWIHFEPQKWRAKYRAGEDGVKEDAEAGGMWGIGSAVGGWMRGKRKASG